MALANLLGREYFENIAIVQINHWVFIDVTTKQAVQEYVKMNQFKITSENRITYLKTLTAWHGCAFIQNNKIKEI